MHESMWKDFFYFSKGQRVGIVVLIGLIILLIGLRIALPKLLPKEHFSTDEAFIQKVALFKASLQERPRYAINLDSQKYKKKIYTPVLFQFNPNTLDSSGFIELGLKPFLASRILKYRAKGGKFRTEKDFEKLYGLSSAQYLQLLPYITIPIDMSEIRRSDSLKIVRLYEEALMVELNGADTCELKMIKGIGSGCAKRIIRYREALGGYVNKNQLKEVWGMTDSLYNKLKGHLKADSLEIKKIVVNRAGIDKLRNHPYLNFYHAKAIYELRRNKGRLNSVDDLKDVPEISKEVLEKIAPYLDFK